jgi:hypothetical protein
LITASSPSPTSPTSPTSWSPFGVSTLLPSTSGRWLSGLLSLKYQVPQ